MAQDVNRKATCIWLVLQIIRSKFRINVACTSHKSFTIYGRRTGHLKKRLIPTRHEKHMLAQNDKWFQPSYLTASSKSPGTMTARASMEITLRTILTLNVQIMDMVNLLTYSLTASHSMCSSSQCQTGRALGTFKT